MSVIDVVVIVFLCGWTVRGYLVGLSISLATFSGVIAGLAGGIFLTPGIADVTPEFLGETSTKVAVIYLIIFLFISSFFRVMALFLKKAIKGSSLADADSFTGAIFALLEGLILAGILSVAMVFCPSQAVEKDLKGSFIAKYLLYSARITMFTLSDQVGDRINKIILSKPGDNYKSINPTPSALKTTEE